MAVVFTTFDEKSWERWSHLSNEDKADLKAFLLSL